MFHRLLVPIKPAKKPLVGLEALVKLARAANASLVFVSVEGGSDAALAGKSAPLILDVMHENRDLAEAALRWVREHFDREGLDVEMLLLKGHVVDTVLACAKERGCDAIVFTHHSKSWLSSLTGNIGDAIIRKSPIPVLIIKQ